RIKDHSPRLLRIFSIYEEHRDYNQQAQYGRLVHHTARKAKMLFDGLQRGDDFYKDKIQSFGSSVTKDPKFIYALFTEEISDEEFIALWSKYFTLHYFQKELAISAVRHYATSFKKAFDPSKKKFNITDDVINIFCDRLNRLSPQIEGEINILFSAGFLKERSERYNQRTWRGFSPLNEIVHYRTQSVSKVLFEDVPEKQMTVYYNQDLMIPPQDIIIETYGGNTKTSQNKPSEFTDLPLSDTMMSIGIELGDSAFDIFQGDQLTPEHFEETHALLLKRMSDFIHRVRTKYPTSKIYLKGSSFGGFFATSYGLLSSNSAHASFYKEWARTALQKHFGMAHATPIDGLITHASGIDYIANITETDALTHLQVPILVHQNYDDERVPLSTHLRFFKQIPVEYLYFSLSRFGAEPFMDDGMLTNIRGHFLNRQASQEFHEAILHFMDVVRNNKFGANRSEFAKHQTLRRLKLANPELESESTFTKKDVEQFLSNLRYMEISGHRNVDEALKWVNVPKETTSEKEESYNKLMDYVSTKKMYRSLTKAAEPKATPE
ncbi:MAG: hypothetical protein Q8K36_05535, partial [Alphaproteobacteria bacterium]|nr:hypothetical protein [Alphaproteobacteria bacterium]